MESGDKQPPVIQLRDVYRTYQMGDQSLNALDGVDLEISRNVFFACIGASGSGQSTMLNFVGWLVMVTCGDYWLFGTIVGVGCGNVLALARYREMGVVVGCF